MAPAKRKRSRPTHSLKRRVEPPTTKAKKNASADDEEILSDEVDSEPDQMKGAADATSDGDDDEDDDDLNVEPPNETAEERRLRLARAYLRHVGVSEDAGGTADGGIDPGEEADDDDDDDDDGDDDEDPENTRLREQALAESGRGVIRLADRLSEEDLCARTKARTRGRGHVLAPTCVSLAREQGATAVSGGKDSRVVVWDVETGRAVTTYKPTNLKSVSSVSDANGHVGHVHAAVISDDATLIASGGDDSLIRIWDVRERRGVTSLRGHRGAVYGLALRAGSRQLFSASRDRLVKIWDVAERAYVETLYGHGADVNDVDAMLTERALSCGRDGTVRLYKIAEGSQLLFRSATTMSIDSVAAINEQRFISGGDDGSVCLWQLNKKKPTAVKQWAHKQGLDADAWIASVCAFRNSDLGISGAGDGKVRFWKCENVPKLVEIGNMNVGPGFVNGLSVSRRRNVLAIAVGNEHRLGRWCKIGKARNTIQFVSMPLEGE